MKNTSDKSWLENHVYVLVGLILVLIFSLGAVAAELSKQSKTLKPETAVESEEPKKPAFDIAAFYDGIQMGMSQESVNKMATKAPSKCDEDSNIYTGTKATCMWVSYERGGVTVEFTDGKVSGKSKLGF